MNNELYQTSQAYLAKTWGQYDKPAAARILDALIPATECENPHALPLRFTFATLDATFKANTLAIAIFLD